MITMTFSVFRTALETKSSQYEACLGYIQDVEQARAKKDKIIEDLKKQIDEMGASYSVKLRVSWKCID